jgi:transcription elongation GreA/GreB family factor
VKQELLNQLLVKMREELRDLEIAAQANKDFATDQEFKAESKYDTRSLEASYLASAEAKRVEDLKLEIQMLEEIDLKSTEEISIGSLVELKHQEQVRTYFLIPIAGGTMLNLGDQAVLVVSVFSPLGAEILGLKAGDEFEVETPKEIRNYRVISFE